MRDDYFNDLDNLLEYTKRRRWQWQVFLDAVTFIAAGLATYYIVNITALNIRFNYSFTKRDAASTVSSVTTTTPSNQSGVGNSDQSNITEPNINIPTDMPESGIYISKINAKAPIMWNGQTGNIQELLKDGVAQIGGSSMPGLRGNVFMTGHSSNLPWADGNYKTIFALLDKLENGDEIIIRNQKQNFLYKVYNKQVVKKEDVGNFVITDKSQSLTIMTCFPVGSNWKRLIVQAERQAQ
jgi:LPXTG-site transpeptidase (sortase) family protein